MSATIFVTGSSGCIGHYVVERFLNDARYQLVLLMRDPTKLKFDPAKFSNVSLVAGDLEHIEVHQKILAKTDILIHIATAWGDSDLSTQVNKDKTLEMLGYCSDRLQKVIYFSTASILGADNHPIPEAESLGTGYIRSKYRTYAALKSSPCAAKLITIFPTMVFGGDAHHPYSHISAGIGDNSKWLRYLKYVYFDARFHFLHAYDIAGVVAYAVTQLSGPQDLVVGNPVMTAKQVIADLCGHYGVKIGLRLKIAPWFILGLIKLFRIKIAPWDRFCIQHPFFEYNVVSPATFGLKTKYPTLRDVL